MLKVFAQTIKYETGCINKEGIEYFICKFIGVINLFYWIGLVLGIALIMWAGAKYIYTRGKDWHNELFYVILGIVLIIASFSIPILIFSFLK